jgi:hypothetical protein
MYETSQHNPPRSIPQASTHREKNDHSEQDLQNNCSNINAQRGKKDQRSKWSQSNPPKICSRDTTGTVGQFFAKPVHSGSSHTTTTTERRQQLTSAVDLCTPQQQEEGSNDVSEVKNVDLCTPQQQEEGSNDVSEVKNQRMLPPLTTATKRRQPASATLTSAHHKRKKAATKYPMSRTSARPGR